MNKLTEVALKKDKTEAKLYKLANGSCMYPLLQANGTKYLQIRFLFKGGEKLLSLGIFQDETASQAHEHREDGRKIRTNDTDLGTVKQAQKNAKVELTKNSLELVAREWFLRHPPKWNENHSSKIIARLKKNVVQWIGTRPIAEIVTTALLAAIRRKDASGTLETAPVVPLNQYPTMLRKISEYSFILSALAVFSLASCGVGVGSGTETTATLTSISISPTTLNMATGGSTKSLTATGTYSDSTTTNISSAVTWISSNTAVATITSGVVTSTAYAGTSKITASLSGISSNSVTVTTTVSNQMGGALQGIPLNLTTVVTTLAGTGTQEAIDGIGTAASFYNPYGITTDGSNLYVGEYRGSRIRKIVIATGMVTTLAGSEMAGAIDGIGTAASFNEPRGITTDGSNLYVSDTSNNKIRKIVIATGMVTTLAGSGTAGAFDGTGTEASFNTPSGITTDSCNLYVADISNNKIRKIVIATGVVTTLAGSGTAGAFDSTGTEASFNHPNGITTDGSNLYVADYYNHKIRKIVIATGVVTTLAGSETAGAIDGTGTAAAFYFPNSITTDGSNLYVADTFNYKIRKIVITTGVVTTLAGSGTAGAVDGTGTAASFNTPAGITTDGNVLYVSDLGNNKIRKIQ